MGNLVAEKPTMCGDPRVHIHPMAQAASAKWRITEVSGGKGEVTIRSINVPSGCTTAFLTASASCGTTTVVLAPAASGTKALLQRWKLTRASNVE
jgi:hypothetical protein